MSGSEDVGVLLTRAACKAYVCLQDDGADIDVSALLLPEPGLASDAPEVQAEPASANVMALDVTREQSGATGIADADEADEGFGEQLAEAGKVTGSFYIHCLCWSKHVQPGFTQTVSTVEASAALVSSAPVSGRRSRA